MALVAQIYSDITVAQHAQTNNVNKQDSQLITEGGKTETGIKDLLPPDERASVWILYPYI